MIFVDTSFWVALHFARDRRHREATGLAQAHGSERLVSSNHVRGETWTFLRRQARHTVAVDFLNRLDRGAAQTIFVSDEVEHEALDWLRRHDEREYSFVDATSFALMRSVGISKALAFDGDFAAAGFEELRL